MGSLPSIYRKERNRTPSTLLVTKATETEMEKNIFIHFFFVPGDKDRNPKRQNIIINEVISKKMKLKYFFPLGAGGFLFPS